jgi:hypothetical protein
MILIFAWTVNVFVFMFVCETNMLLGYAMSYILSWSHEGSVECKYSETVLRYFWKNQQIGLIRQENILKGNL